MFQSHLSNVSKVVDHELEKFFGSALTDNRSRRFSTFPRLNVSESDKAFLVQAQLAGYGEDEIDLNFIDNVLTLKSHKEENHANEEEGHFKHHEFNYSSFERQLKFNSPIVKEGIEAKFDKGILSITLPKQEKEKAHKINIKVD